MLQLARPAEPLAKLPVFHHHALCCCGCPVLCFILQAEARLSTQRAAVEEAEAVVQEALRRLREAEVRGAQAALCMIGKILILSEGHGSISWPVTVCIAMLGPQQCCPEQSTLSSPH
jgi:hypothetical protein